MATFPQTLRHHYERVPERLALRLVFAKQPDIEITYRDLIEKSAGFARQYAEAGVKEYWIVCPEEKQVEVYRQPGADGYAERMLLAASAVIECSALPGVRVDLAALFA